MCACVRWLDRRLAHVRSNSEQMQLLFFSPIYFAVSSSYTHILSLLPLCNRLRVHTRNVPVHEYTHTHTRVHHIPFILKTIFRFSFVYTLEKCSCVTLADVFQNWICAVSVVVDVAYTRVHQLPSVYYWLAAVAYANGMRVVWRKL